MADPHRVRRRALGALAAVVAVALGVSGILAAGAYAAARMAGLTDDGGGHSSTTQTVSAAPSHAPSPSASASGTTVGASDPSPTGHHEGGTQHASQPSGHRRPQGHQHHAQPRRAARHHRHARPPARRHQHHRRHHHRRHQHQRRHRSTGVLTLHAARTRVRPMGRIDLGGRCGCRSGTSLVVQRREHGRWVRFPASATASHGRFHTWVMTGRRGANEFRVVLPGGPVSNPVTITVG